MIPLSPSSGIGLVQPNARIDDAICATCASEWVRALLAMDVDLRRAEHTVDELFEARPAAVVEVVGRRDLYEGRE